MLRYVYGRDQLVANFVAAMITYRRVRFGPFRAIGVLRDDNELIAGAVYQILDEDAGLVEITLAAVPGQRWLTPTTLAVIYRYPFLDLGAQQVVHRFPAENEALQRQGAAFGCALIRWPDMFGPGKDAILALLNRADWMSNKVCQRYKHHVAITKRKAA